MIKISKVIIENFQSHKNTVLDLKDGLNVIIGPSDQGKSAIVRAMKWVLYNEPRGNDFIRQGTTTARVTLELSNGFHVTRERSQSRNRYIVTKPDGEQSVYEGFGNEVPEEVYKAHGIQKVVLDTDISSSINISEQLEGPFLLSESGAVRAKAIGRLTGLHIIDRAIRNSIVDLKREVQTADRVSKDILEVQNKLGEYEKLEELEKVLHQSEGLIANIEKLKTRLSILEQIRISYESIENERERLLKTLKALSNINESTLLIKSSELIVLKLGRIEKIHQSLLDIGSRIREMKSIIHETQMVNEGIEKIRIIYEKKERYEKLTKLSAIYSKVQNEFHIFEKVLGYTQNIDTLEGILIRLQKAEIMKMKLEDIGYRFKESAKERKYVRESLEKLHYTTQNERILKDVEEKIFKMKKLEFIVESYKKTMDSIHEGYKFLEKNKIDIKNLLKEYTVVLEKGGKCPVCSSSIDQSTLNTIIKHYKEVH